MRNEARYRLVSTLFFLQNLMLVSGGNITQNITNNSTNSTSGDTSTYTYSERLSITAITVVSIFTGTLLTSAVACFFKRKQLAHRVLELAQGDRKLAQGDRELTQGDRRLTQGDEELKEQIRKANEDLKRKDVELEIQNKVIGQRNEELKIQQVATGQRDEELSIQRTELAELKRKTDAELNQKDVALKQKDTELALKAYDCVLKGAELVRSSYGSDSTQWRECYNQISIFNQNIVDSFKNSVIIHSLRGSPTSVDVSPSSDGSSKSPASFSRGS